MGCQYWTGTFCEATPTRPYVSGPRCANHTPAKVAGRQDHAPDPARSLDVLRAAVGFQWGFNRHETTRKQL